MSTNGTMGQGVSRRIVCELGPSVRAEERVQAALAACEEHAAELYVVWVFQPAGFDSHPGAFGGAAGTFGLPAVLARAIELARERGIAATSAVRFAEHEVVLRRETGSPASIAHRADRGLLRVAYAAAAG
jgi:hypothetical protein